MQILVTNDDGISSKGIRTLVKVLAREHFIYVIAPDRERSATGHALTLDHPLRVQKVDLGIDNTTAWQTSGTPTDCIKLALCSILYDKPIDLIITGINHGPNLGADVLYSGTVNAAIEGAIYSIPSIAMSLTDGHVEDADFESPSEFLLKFLKEFPNLNLPLKTVVNINFPSKAVPELSNMRISQLGKRMYCDMYDERVDPRGKVYYWLSGQPIDTDELDESDVMTVKRGNISVTPIHFRLTDNEVIQHMKDYFNLPD